VTAADGDTGAVETMCTDSLRRRGASCAINSYSSHNVLTLYIFQKFHIREKFLELLLPAVGHINRMLTDVDCLIDRLFILCNTT